MYLHPHSIVHKVATGVPAEIATLFIPISNGIRWMIQEGGAQVGSSVVVFGPGQHGLGCVVAAAEAGVGCTIIVGLSSDAERLKLAQELGADVCVVADREDVIERILDVTDGEGVDVAVDVTPDPRTAEVAVRVVRKHGTVVLAGSRKTLLDSEDVVAKELTVKGVRGHDLRSVEPAIRLIESGKYPLQRFCTHVYGLDKVDLALRTVGREAEERPIHVVVRPSAGQ
jgi:threonine dehydrogenase-like Zn-dependent dehydrogenase